MTSDRLYAIELLVAGAALAAAIAFALGARRTVRAHRAAALGAVFALAAFALVLAAHGGYREELRQRLFVRSAATAWLVERVEHLGTTAALIACAALALAIASRHGSRAGPSGPARELERASRLAGAVAGATALVASGLALAAALRLGAVGSP